MNRDRIIMRISGLWRPLILGTFIWLFIGDTIRKLTPGQPWQLMLVLDIFLFLAYTLFAVDYKKKKKSIWHPSFALPILIFTAILFLSVLGPHSAGIKVAMVGFRNYVWFIPLSFLGYGMFHNKETVVKLCRLLSYAAIPLLLLAATQSIFHNTDFTLLNPLNDGHRFHNSGTESIKLTSSFFGSAQRYGMVSMLLFLLGLGTKSLVSLAAFAGVILSGSRSAFALSMLGSVGFLNKKSLPKIALGALVVIVLLFGVPPFFHTVFFQLDSIPKIITSRVPVFLGEMKTLWGSNNVSLFGKGAGAVSQGIDYLTEKQIIPTPPSMGETGIRNLLLELGLVGLVAFYTMWGSILYVMYNELKILKDAVIHRIGLAILLFAVLILSRFTFMHAQALNDYAVLVPLWFFIGVFFRLKSYEDTPHNPNLPARV